MFFLFLVFAAGLRRDSTDDYEDLPFPSMHRDQFHFHMARHASSSANPFETTKTFKEVVYRDETVPLKTNSRKGKKNANEFIIHAWFESSSYSQCVEKPHILLQGFSWNVECNNNKVYFWRLLCISCIDLP